VPTRVAVLGLDGLCWPYLNKLLEHGAMPFTKALLQKSLKTELYSYPPSTMPAWTSIMTGVNPGKHGVFGFYALDPRRGVKRMYSANDLGHPRVHEMLAMQRVPSIAINPVPPHPLIPMKNLHVLVHHFLAPKAAYYPRSLSKYLRALEEIPLITPQDPDMAFKHYVLKVQVIKGLVEELMARLEDWRLFWLMLEVPDHLLHRVPTLLDEFYPCEATIFKTVDDIIRMMVEYSDYLIIVSDHGFTKCENFISVNDVLVKNGLAIPQTWREIKERGFRMSPSLYRLAKKLLPTPLRKLLKAAYKKVKGRNLQIRLPSVDMVGSKAFMYDNHSYGVYIRDEAVRNRVMKCLSRVPGLKVLEREKVYWGRKKGRAPHIMLYPDFDGGYNLANPWITGLVIIKRRRLYHHPLGVLMLYPNNLPVNIPHRMYTYHVAPLIMSLLDLPLSHVHDAEWIATSQNLADYVGKWDTLRRIYRTKRRMLI